MKNLIENISLNDRVQIALQCYDKGAITEEQMSEITGIDFDSGEFNEIWNNGSITSGDISQLIMQFFDKGLITKKVLQKTIFGDLEK